MCWQQAASSAPAGRSWPTSWSARVIRRWRRDASPSLRFPGERRGPASAAGLDPGVRRGTSMTLLALPSPRDEAWRWSDLAGLPALADAAPSGQPRDVDDLWIDTAGPRLLFVDGVYDASRSDPGAVQVGPAESRAAQHPRGRVAGTQGWSLTLGREAASDPIQIVHVSTGGANHLAAEIVL